MNNGNENDNLSSGGLEGMTPINEEQLHEEMPELAGNKEPSAESGLDNQVQSAKSGLDSQVQINVEQDGNASVLNEEQPVSIGIDSAESLISDKPEPVITNLEQRSKTNNTSLIIILLVSILLVGIGIGCYLVFSGVNKNTNRASSNNSKKEFLTLANSYVTKVQELWNNDALVCQDAINPGLLLKPSALSDKDAYSGNAFYYVFINTADASELNLGISNQKPVAGWVRIGKSDNSFYIALSDGKNYIVDKGTEYGVLASSLTVNDVITTGNGNNYQYMNGEIFGSNTEGNGWGIGDYKLLTDGDDTNDGIYMSNGKKTAGYTPFCTNIAR